VIKLEKKIGEVVSSTLSLLTSENNKIGLKDLVGKRDSEFNSSTNKNINNRQLLIKIKNKINWLVVS